MCGCICAWWDVCVDVDMSVDVDVDVEVLLWILT